MKELTSDLINPFDICEESAYVKPNSFPQPFLCGGIKNANKVPQVDEKGYITKFIEVGKDTSLTIEVTNAIQHSQTGTILPLITIDQFEQIITNYDKQCKIHLLAKINDNIYDIIYNVITKRNGNNLTNPYINDYFIIKTYHNGTCNDVVYDVDNDDNVRVKVIVPSSITYDDILNKFYPVGTIYLSDNGNINPNTQMGGIWVALPEGLYLKACDNITTAVGTVIPASLAPSYGSIVGERLGRYSDAYIVDGGFKILGNYNINGPGSQSGTSCPVIAFDASWNTNIPNNPYRQHGLQGEDGMVDVKHYTCLVWKRVLSNEAKQKQIEVFLDTFNKNIDLLNSNISKAKAILSTNLQKTNMKKTLTEGETILIDNENKNNEYIVNNNEIVINHIKEKIEAFKKLNGVK